MNSRATTLAPALPGERPTAAGARTPLDLFLGHLAHDPHAVAVCDDRGHSLTRADLWELAGDIEREFVAHGLNAGDLVILCMPNWTEWMASYLGAVRGDLIPATLPVTTDPKSIAYTAQLVGAKAVVLPGSHRGRDFAAESAVLAEELGREIHVLLVDGTDGTRTWRTFAGPPVAVPPYPEGLAHVLFSSSTTGKSKAIAHSESSLSAYNRMVIDRYEVSGEHPIFMPSPLGHSTGFWHGARMSLMTGAALVLQDAWDPRRALELVERYGCEITVAATPFLKDVVDTAWDSAAPKLAGMRIFLCGGAPVAPSLIEQAQEQMPGTRIAAIWAMSEGGATSSLPDDSVELVARTCGKVMPGVTLETIDDRGVIAPRGTDGEIVMRTPSLFLGYIGQDELYRNSFTADGWFRTGDTGIVDDNGYLRLTGRLKDLIIRGGVNISPVEIENALSGHPQISRVAVVGSPDERLGERICAVVQSLGDAPSFDELIGWLSERNVPRRLWPESIRIVSAMPETPAGKIRKNVLRELVSSGDSMTANIDSVTTQTVTLRDIDVTYTRAGQGPAVVLIHGLAEDHRSWRAVQAADLGVTTYAYDLRGHGRTTVGSPAGTLTQLRDDLIAFLEEITGPAICVGFSLGGTVVLSAAAERPDLVTEVVALGTSSVVGRGAAGFYAGRIDLFRGTDRAEQQAALRADTAAALHNPASDLDAVTAFRLDAVGEAHGYINASTAMAALVESPLTPELSRIGTEVPVTIVGADNDTFCPRKAADIILGAIEHATYHEITGAGHLMLVDQPEQSIDLLHRILGS
ncbi:alpha/beta fold hydrolase [Rhodococcus sp. CH91]|uniref:alpha/beta fold hydrolase n=1 Tax=Rhodococcus sp. CH91 TaxID=2910256 RepID=UPI001F4B186B|nr:alpha/beta fold hydrolase [Rhodococcus sp. CH91]